MELMLLNIIQFLGWPGLNSISLITTRCIPLSKDPNVGWPGLNSISLITTRCLPLSKDPNVEVSVKLVSVKGKRTIQNRKTFDPTKPVRLDHVATSGFLFLNCDEIDGLAVDDLNDNVPDGKILEIDLKYPTHLHNHTLMTLCCHPFNKRFQNIAVK